MSSKLTGMSSAKTMSHKKLILRNCQGEVGVCAHLRSLQSDDPKASAGDPTQNNRQSWPVHRLSSKQEITG